MPFSDGDTDWILQESRGWPIFLQILARERLLTLQEGLHDDEGKPEAQRQIQPSRHLLRPGNPTQQRAVIIQARAQARPTSGALRPYECAASLAQRAVGPAPALDAAAHRGDRR